MTDETLDFLKTWTAKHDAKLDKLTDQVSDLRQHMNRRFTDIEQRLKMVEGHLAGLVQADVDRAAAYRDLRDRIERIEQHLQLS